jgi:hypothetical protein
MQRRPLHLAFTLKHRQTSLVDRNSAREYHR